MTLCVHSTRAGSPCKNHAMLGQTECHKHGGAAPQKRAAAARRQAEQSARQMLWDFGAAPTTDPLTELAALSGRLRHAVEVLQSQENTKEPCVCCGFGDPDLAATHAARALAKEYRTVLSELTRLGFEERRVRIEQEKWTVMVACLVAGVTAAGITDDHLLLVARDAALAKAAELEAVVTMPGEVLESRAVGG